MSVGDRIANATEATTAATPTTDVKQGNPTPDIAATGEVRQNVNVGDRRPSETETTVATPKRDVEQGNPTPDIAATGEVRQHVSVGDRRASEAETKVATPKRDIEQGAVFASHCIIIVRNSRKWFRFQLRARNPSCYFSLW